MILLFIYIFSDSMYSTIEGSRKYKFYLLSRLRFHYYNEDSLKNYKIIDEYTPVLLGVSHLYISTQTKHFIQSLIDILFVIICVLSSIYMNI